MKSRSAVYLTKHKKKRWLRKMEEIKLDVQVRDQIGRRKVKRIRREDFVPAIVYGGKKKGPAAIQVD